MALRILLLCVGAWLAPSAQAQPRPLRVDFLSVGQGDAALITSPTGKTVLVDGGPRKAGPGIVSFLRGRGVGPLDLVLLTHRHADHLGGLAAVIDSRGARLFLDAPFPHQGPAYDALLRILEARKVPVRNAEHGRRIDLGGGAQLILLGPPQDPFSRTRSDVNSNSVIARLDHGQVRILFMADAESPTETWLLNQKLDLRAQVLKVAHHGSRYSSTLRFVKAVNPTLAIISSGIDNDYGHPAPSIIARLERLGAHVLRTDLRGTITVFSDGVTARIDPRTNPNARNPL